MTIVAFTGHRPDSIGGYDIPNPIYDFIMQRLEEELLKINPQKCISGMSLGVDTWAAELCIKLNIPFTAAIPFIGQESLWKACDRRTYHDLLLEANDTIVVSTGSYAPYKMQLRNEWMVDNSDILLAVFNGSTGGTYNCVKYAQKLNKKIIIINPNFP